MMNIETIEYNNPKLNDYYKDKIKWICRAFDLETDGFVWDMNFASKVIEYINQLDIDKTNRSLCMYDVEINVNGTTITPSSYTSESKWMIRNNIHNSMLQTTLLSCGDFFKKYLNDEIPQKNW